MPSTFRIIQIDHIGIAVKQSQSLSIVFQHLGIPFLATETVHDQNVATTMFDVDSVHLELLEALNEESPITKFLQKKGEGIHHIALRVDNLQNAINELTQLGLQMIDMQPRKGAGGKLIAFIHPKSTGGILFELSQVDN